MTMQRGGGPPSQYNAPSREDLEKRRSQIYKEYRTAWEANKEEPSVSANEKQADLASQIKELDSQIENLSTEENGDRRILTTEENLEGPGILTREGIPSDERRNYYRNRDNVRDELTDHAYK